MFSLVSLLKNTYYANSLASNVKFYKNMLYTKLSYLTSFLNKHQIFLINDSTPVKISKDISLTARVNESYDGNNFKSR